MNDTSRHDPDSLAGRLKASLEAAASRHDKPALPADAIKAAATASYFKAAGDYGFDHQRDAYEQGYENGAEEIRDQATAAEREACAQLAENEARSHRPVGGKALNIAARIRARGTQ